MTNAELQLAADLALSAALEKYKRFTIPEPLEPCSRCGRHAAFYAGTEKEGTYYCGPCGPRVSIFRLPVPETDLRVLAADAALKAKGHPLDGLEPLLYEGDQA